MNFDLRLPIGLMFSLFGAMLTIYGLVGGIKIDWAWGAFMLIFGLIMLTFALRGRSQNGNGPQG